MLGERGKGRGGEVRQGEWVCLVGGEIPDECLSDGARCTCKK